MSQAPSGLLVYLVFDFSDNGSTCAGQASAPGGQSLFGDICTYK
jgi:hypothetical protein